MKRLFALIVILASGLALSAAAQTPVAPAAARQAKVAVIFLQKALDQTNEGQRNYADLKKKYEPKRLQLDQLTNEIENLQKDLQAQGGTLTDAERAKRAKTIEDKKKHAQRFAEDTQNDFQQEMQQQYSTLAAKVYKVLVAYAQQQGYTLVLDGSQQQSPLLYLNPATDITKAIVDAYNLQSNVPASPVKPAATAPKPAAKPPVKH
jgi:outer membrane protein